MGVPRGLIAAAALAVAGAGLLACGDEESATNAGDAGDAAAIAATINEAREAFAAGDGEATCALLTDEGTSFMLTIAAQSRPPLDAVSCEEVVEGVAQLPAFQREPPPAKPEYEASDVNLGSGDPGFNGIDTVPEDGPRFVEVPCRPDGNAAGAYYLTESGDGWRLTLPFCTGA